MVIKKTDMVVKSNRLIEACYRLSLVEQQIVLFTLCRARDEQKGLFADLPITISAAEFAEKFGTEDGGNVYRQLRDALNTLFTRSVTIRDTHEETGKPRITETRWISDKSYVEGAGLIQLTFAPKVIPYITRLESEFTSYRLEKIGKMTSAHAVRLYEILVQFLSIGRRELEVKWLREILCLDGEYPEIGDFKKRVIEVAVEQINKHSDITVSYTQIKTGRAVTSFDFKIKRTPPPKPKSDKPKPKKVVINRAFIEQHALTGESYEQAFKRLRELHGHGQAALDL